MPIPAPRSMTDGPLGQAPPEPRRADPATAPAGDDLRPRWLRWLLPSSCASAAPLDGVQKAKLHLIAYH